MRNEDSPGFWLKPVPLGFLLIGLGGLIYFFLFNYSTDSDPNFLIEIGKVLCSVAISSGFIGLLLEVKTIKSIILSVLNTILDGDYKLDSYSIEKLHSIKKRVIIAEHNKKFSEQELENSIYALEDNINTLITNRYYELDETFCWIEPDDEEKIFNKRFKRKLIISNKYSDNNIFKMTLKLVREEDDTDYINWLSFKEFKVYNDTSGDPQDLKEEIQRMIKVEKLPEDDRSPYTHILTVEKQLDGNKKVTVFIEYQYSSPMTDFTQTFKSILPCKEFCHKVFIDGKYDNNWTFAINGFAPLYFPGSNISEKFKVDVHTNKSGEVIFNNWCLPGTGYVVSLRRINE
ncbi:MAG: hypothetical protein APF84_14395 [Gracilibacter sp. BRH_c7a]|nr:MAG: hypothetical protein APF84_14395 [Gracilibacter sp. BRH_c7a]